LKKKILDYKNLIKEKDNNMNEQLNNLNEIFEDLRYQKQISEMEIEDLENYKNYLENKIKDFILNLSKTSEIYLNIENKCNNILKNETEKVREQIEESIYNSNYLLRIENEKNKENERAINDFIRESKHINIIALGRTGVGKSELIN